ncbi:cellulose biosynthesis protein BcsG [Vibrio sp. 10N]|uniref:cellulose biosynthesis protein BcsG n=1 Tax=Vibrio sp. 10N TaxID=3058938 RepID=UPI002813DE55|nr:cellulose biosynthesis protein BcsG [Vibrio sp. 10N]
MDRTKPSAHISLGWWTLYFALKLALYATDTLSFSPLYNFSLLCLVLIPLHSRWLNIARHSIAIVLAVLLLHHDSYLPPLERLFSQWDLVSQFDTVYLLALVKDFVSLDFLLLSFVLIVGYLYLGQILRLSAFVVAGMVIASIPSSFWQLSLTTGQTVESTVSTSGTLPTTTVTTEVTVDTSSEGLTSYLGQFFSEQAAKSSSLSRLDTLPTPPNFDILFLSVCSLAWDDLEYSGNINHPIFKEFDILFKRFNSATSYSGPAVLRILRANCGQQSHADLFNNNLTAQCSLFDQLARLGYQKEVFMNHDGKFDGFNKHIANNIGSFSPAVDIETMTPSQYAFDGTRIYSDGKILSQWEQIAHTKPTVSLYNTISIHDGNRVVGQSGSRLMTYKRQQKILLDELYQFFQSLKASNRNVVVVLLPEHGAAVRGDRMQISGMREIPTKAITNVPVGIKFFGDVTIENRRQIDVEQPVSFLALSDLLSNILSSQMYAGKATSLSSLTQGLPTTPVVSQNSGTTMLEVNDTQFYSFDDQSWTEYRPRIN